uniref:Uncharacterized protein n=1 Tax=Ditylenchus dipsaci TaxID=166011 RepID=A0A915DIS2_9BILA
MDQIQPEQSHHFLRADVQFLPHGRLFLLLSNETLIEAPTTAKSITNMTSSLATNLCSTPPTSAPSQLPTNLSDHFNWTNFSLTMLIFLLLSWSEICDFLSKRKAKKMFKDAKEQLDSQLTMLQDLHNRVFSEVAPVRTNPAAIPTNLAAARILSAGLSPSHLALDIQTV